MQQEPIKAKKKLSQHFLKDRLLAKRIVDSLNLKPNDQVLEIGYGTGALTELLVGKCFYNGVELDQSLYLKVKKEFDGPKRKFLKELRNFPETSISSKISRSSKKSTFFKKLRNFPVKNLKI